MQISTSVFYDQATQRLSDLNAYADKLNTQISTTKRFTAPSDDVVAYQKLAQLKQQNTDATSYNNNLALAGSLLDQSDTQLAAVTDMIQQAQEQAVRANSGTMSDTDRQAIATQLRSILDSLVNIANTKDTRNQPLFGAATGDSAVTVAADGTVSFTGTGTPASIPVGDGESIQPTESAANVFGGIQTDSGTTDLFSIIKNLADTLDTPGSAGVATAAGAAIDGLNAASDHVSGVRASLGARNARVDLEQQQATDTATDREVQRSGLEDTDITSTVIALQKTMTVLSATQASFTKLSSLSLFDYLK